MTNALSNESYISVCCIPDELDPADTFCYRNGTFPVWEILTTIVSNISIAFYPLQSREWECSETAFDLEYYPPNNDVFYLREDGEIHVVKSRYKGYSPTNYDINLTDYCFTSHLTENGRKVAISVCNDFTIVYRLPDLLMIRIEAGLTMSFFGATFLIYTILPELNNVPGFILRAYVASYFATSTLYVIVSEIQLTCNYLIALLTYFFTMAYWIWVTVMCFDIWWTFRRVRSSRSSSKQGNRKKCIIYSISAWGSSAFLTGVAAIIDSVPTVPEGLIRPALRDSCFFIELVPFAIYWIGPLSLTVICDICYFVLTAIILIRHEKDTAHRLHGIDEQLYKNEQKRFWVYVKLVIVMGIANLTDLINLLWVFELPFYARILFNLPSTLQGFNIFVIFVCKKNIIKLLSQRLGRRHNTVPQNVELQPRN